MIVNKYNQGGGGSGSGMTPQQVQQQIDTSLTPYWDSGETKDYVDEQGFLTSADTQDYVTSADVKTQVEAYDYATVAQLPVVPTSNTAFTNDAGYLVSSDVADFVTSADVKTQVEAYKYITSADAKTQIEAYDYATVAQLPVVPTSNTAFTNDEGYVTSADVKTQVEEYHYVVSGDVKSQVEAYEYVNSAQVETQITNKGYITNQALTAYTPTSDFATVNGSAITAGGNLVIQGGGSTGGSTEDIELPIAAAVNGLKNNIEVRLDQQYYKKQEVLNLVRDKLTAAQASEQIVDIITPLFEAVYDAIENKELAISAAINDLNTRINNL